MSKFTVQVVVDIEMDVDEAAHLLSDPDPKKAVNDYLITRHNTVTPTFIGTYNAEKIRQAHGIHLSDERVAAQRQLPASNGAKEVA